MLSVWRCGISWSLEWNSPCGFLFTRCVGEVRRFLSDKDTCKFYLISDSMKIWISTEKTRWIHGRNYVRESGIFLEINLDVIFWLLVVFGIRHHQKIVPQKFLISTVKHLWKIVSISVNSNYILVFNRLSYKSKVSFKIYFTIIQFPTGNKNPLLFNKLPQFKNIRFF